MAAWQTTYWRDLPSLVVARDGTETVKVPLAPRLQEAIDEAAMRLGDVGSDAYLAGWRRSDWSDGDGTPAELAAAEAARLEAEWSSERVAAFLEDLGPAQSDETATG